MAARKNVVHAGYKLMLTPMTLKGERSVEGFRLFITNSTFRITRSVRRDMIRFGKELGIKPCFRQPYVGCGDVYLSPSPRFVTTESFEARVHRFARRFAHAGVEREDTVLAEIRLLNVA